MKWFLAIVFLMYGIPKFFISQFTPELIAQKGIVMRLHGPFLVIRESMNILSPLEK